MNFHRFMTALAGIGIAAFLAPQPAPAAQFDLEKAIFETQKAIAYGDDPHHSSSYVQHAENAIDHAMTAQKAKPNAQVAKGIGYLRKGIKATYDTHWISRERRGAAQAKKALKQFQAAQSRMR